MEAKCNLPKRRKVFAAVLFQDKIYVALKVLTYNWTHTKHSMLYCSSGQLLSWNRLTTFDVVNFGLGAYQSKLVRVGGVEDEVSVLSSVLVSDDGITWQDSLRPLPTRRDCPMVVTVGRNPEYLVVAGGSPELKYLPTVEVLAEGQWYTLQSFPVPGIVRNHCFHNGKLFMTIDSLGSFPHSVFFCEAETLLAQCTECVAGKEPRSSLWKTIDKECDVGYSTKFNDEHFVAENFSIFYASHGGYLVTVKCSLSGQFIWAHSPYTKSWIPVSKICTRLGCVLVSRASDLVIFYSDVSSDKVLKITLHGKVQLELHCKDFLGKAVTVMSF